MKTILLMVSALFLIQFANAQVSGKAFLSGATDHTGIKVHFQPTSPSAALDSTYTDAGGNYSIALSPGNYIVTFSKFAYQTIQYNNGNPKTIAANATLNDVSLTPGSFQYVSGNVSGHWTANNTYIVTGDITVPQGSSLSIAPGTTIRFDDGFGLRVEGKLTAVGGVGTAIIMTSNSSSPDPGSWGEIYIDDADNSILSYCHIEYGTRVYVTKSDIEISYCTIKNSDGDGLHLSQSDPIIKSNLITQFKGKGIYAAHCNSALIEHNHIHHNELSALNYGIYLMGSSAIVSRNEVHHIIDDYHHAAVAIYDHSGSDDNVRITNNIVHHNKTGILVLGSGSSSLNGTVVNNNAIFDNQLAGIYIGINSSDATICNNLIYNNQGQYGGGITGGGGFTNQPTISHNLLYQHPHGHFNNINLAGIGNIITSNSNGVPSDTYYNIFVDPKCSSSHYLPFTLSYDSLSPCIDAGLNSVVTESRDVYFSPRLVDGNHNGGAIVDIGPVEFVPDIFLPITDPKQAGKLLLSPSPTHGELRIDFPNAGTYQVQVFTITGQLVYEQMVEQTLSSQLDLHQLENGIYILKAKTGNKTHTAKFIKTN